ncbi:MAG: SGNH/GDSL hydrolase family protein [Elusimicrobia bacterium]|nr:SGNH/GDSL hydrolase family protein [Elusimicrobiota bacterium]
MTKVRGAVLARAATAAALSAAAALAALELILRLGGFLAAPAEPACDAFSGPRRDRRAVLFIGDSWTGGADAPAGAGYPEVLVRRLNERGPRRPVQGFNLGRGSLNSAEAALLFLKYYRDVRPAVVVALVGINDLWNTEDVALAGRRLNAELGRAPLPAASRWGDGLPALAGRLKLARLWRILRYRMFRRWELAGPHPYNRYVMPYFELHGQGRVEEGRRYLIANLGRASSYDDFYRVMLYSFSYDEEAAQKYLKERGVWRPGLVRYRIDRDQRRRALREKYAILEGHLRDLKGICDRDRVALILQDYPHLDPAVAELNGALRGSAAKLGIEFVDHYALFRKELGRARWKSLLTRSHVNGEGYALMADNLLRHSSIAR